MERKPAITWAQLKEFANTLNEDQLQMPVLAMGNERGFKIQAAEELGEEMYIDDEGMNPLSVFEPFDEEDVLDNYPKVPANTPYLYFDM